ncbi:hypothetical protein [Streptomyces sp. NPDC056160]|uniref:hypothetical protein n=1 Tax=Streptomyces sp. NPDC056160 TaxID=3345731 RepID=UPI0035D6A3EB
MREKPESDGGASAGEEVRKRRIDLSVPQVAGSAVAAVVAAKLASYFGVYGTILGAGVVSVVATCGGSVFQHFFRRTGEQIRTVTVTVPTRPVAAGAPAGVPAGRGAPAPGEFSEGTVYRARVKSWKRPVIAAALVFGVTMAGITAYELVSGSSFSGRGGTTVGDAVTGHRGKPSPSGGDTPQTSTSPGAGTGTGDGHAPGDTSRGPGRGAAGSPTPTPGAGTGSAGTGSPGGAGAGSADGGTGTGGQSSAGPRGDGTPGTGGTATPEPGASATAPAPSASSRSGNGVQDPAGPAAQ